MAKKETLRNPKVEKIEKPQSDSTKEDMDKVAKASNVPVIGHADTQDVVPRSTLGSLPMMYLLAGATVKLQYEFDDKLLEVEGPITGFKETHLCIGGTFESPEHTIHTELFDQVVVLKADLPTP